MKKDYLSKLLALSAVIFFAVLMAIVVIQVAFRALPFATAPSWTEELTRFLLIFAVTAAAPLALQNDSFVRVDLFINHLPTYIRKIIDITTYIGLAIFFAWLIHHAYLFAQNGIQTSPALGIPMYIPYGSMVVLLLLLSVYSIKKIICIYIHKKERGHK